ncbi:MAG: amidase [Myxococcales bacterium]|nr:amidase [Myxococcales bacterium]
MAYDFPPLKAPRTAGTLLRMLLAAAESPATGPMVAQKMLTDIGIVDLRSVPGTESPELIPHPLNRAVTSTGDSSPAMLANQAAEAFGRGGRRGFGFVTAADLVDAYVSKKLSPVDVARRFLEQRTASDQPDAVLRAFIAVQAETIFEMARASEARYSAGKPLSPLDGVPVAIKDEVDMQGYGTTGGTRFLGATPAEADSGVVARLRAAGAVLVGKTNMHELGVGVTGINPHHGPARNPYDPSRCSGGSSSGSAVAVASGLCPVAVGADGGGSIRIPAALCGIVGLKPTFGRVTETGALPICWSLAHIGPMGATVADVAVAFALMAGHDDDDPNTWDRPPVTFDNPNTQDLRGIRVGVYRPWFEDASSAVVKAAWAGVEALQSKGAVVIDIELPELVAVRSAHLVTFASEVVAARMQDTDAQKALYGLDLRLNLVLGKRLTASDYVHAQRVRHRLLKSWQRVFDSVDVIATPSTGQTASPIATDALATGESNLELTDRVMRYAAAANLFGFPAISVPAGYDGGGLPAGLQLMGRAYEEGLLLRLAAAVEQVIERHKPRHYFPLL